MKQLFFSSILFIFFTLTKEKILFISNTNYNKKCDDIKTYITNPNSDSWEYAFNAEYCRLKKPDSGNSDSGNSGSGDSGSGDSGSGESGSGNSGSGDSGSGNSGSGDSNSGNSGNGNDLRNLKESQLEEDICCYVSILNNTSNWNYFCGKITISDYNGKISEYINSLKDDNFKKKFKDIKIDCFSKKLDFMIKILIISLICLI